MSQTENLSLLQTERRCCAMTRSYSRELRLDINEDLILPEFLPDVKKLLMSRFEPQVINQTQESGYLRYEGEISCSVTYVSDTNRLRCATLTIPFSGKEPMEEADAEQILLLPAVTRNDSRMLSPRKLSVRLGLKIRACLLATRSLSCEIEGEEEGLELDYERISTMRFTPTERMGLPLRVDMELENSLPSVCDILCTSVEGTPTKVEISKGKAERQADLLIKCLYEGEGGRSVEVCKRHSMRETVEIPDADEGMRGISMLRCSGVRTNVENNSYGEKRVLEIDAELQLTVWCFGEEEAVIVRDAYSTRYATECESKECNACIFDGVVQTSFSVNYSVEKGEVGGEEMKEIFCGQLQPGEITLTRDAQRPGMMLVEGNAIATMLCERIREDDFGREYLVVRMEVPIKGEIDLRGGMGERMLSHVALHSCRMRCDDSRLYVDFEIGITMPLIREQSLAFVSSLRVRSDRPHEEEDGFFTLFYPSTSDTLWSVAKEHHVTRALLCAANHMEQAENLEKQILLIPRK